MITAKKDTKERSLKKKKKTRSLIELGLPQCWIFFWRVGNAESMMNEVTEVK
jgi:hypothetical protein